MAKQRLQVWMREKLYGQAKEMVAPTKLRAVRDAAYAKAAPLVRVMVEKKYPPKDMAVCERYGVTHQDLCVVMQFPDSSVHRFEFDKTRMDEVPVVIGQSGCHQRMYLADAATAKAVDAWLDASKAFNNEWKKRVEAYNALLQGSTYLDDVIEIWPEARGIIPLNALPIALGPEQLEIINKDRRERSKAAA